MITDQDNDAARGPLGRISSTCRECGAKCCRYFCFEIDKPTDYEEFEDIRWYLMHEGITVHVDDGDWFISIDNRCKALGPDNQCLSYEDRPLICRRYDMAECDYTEGDYGYDELFLTPEDMVAYARKVLGDKEFEAERAKARAKLERKSAKAAAARTPAPKSQAPSAGSSRFPAASRPRRTR